MNSIQATGPVLAGVSRSEANRGAVLWAADEAAWRGLPLRLVHAQDWPAGTHPDAGPDHPAHLWETHFRTTGEHLLDAARRRALERHPGLQVTVRLAKGRTLPVLREEAEECSQLVVGERRLTESEILLAGTGKGASLVGHVPCLLTVVPQQPIARPDDRHPVVVGVDGSPDSARAVESAFEEAVRGGVGLRAVEVRRPREAGRPEFLEESHSDVSQALAGWAEKYPDVEVDWEVLTGHPVLMLAAVSRSARCLVVGSRGRGGFRGMLLGSTSRSLTHRVHCPLLITPAVRGS